MDNQVNHNVKKAGGYELEIAQRISITLLCAVIMSPPSKFQEQDLLKEVNISRLVVLATIFGGKLLLKSVRNWHLNPSGSLSSLMKLTKLFFVPMGLKEYGA
ncbi:hypothetical protein Tco_0410338 [Tanacetum coccineum]